jgi:hypothetical protein
MRALSVRAPYAEEIARGSKLPWRAGCPTEFRSWRTHELGELLICQSGGGAVCIVELVDCVPIERDEHDRVIMWAWLLRNPRRVTSGRIKGRLRLFDVSPSEFRLLETP